jgi:hypothetical protein
MRRMWFYGLNDKLQTTVGLEPRYRLHHFRVFAWLFGLFGVIVLGFIAHAIRWESGAAALLIVAAAVAGFGGRQFWGETMALKQKMPGSRQ